MRLKLLGLLAGVAVLLAGFGVDTASAGRARNSVVAAITSTPVVSYACNLISHSHNGAASRSGSHVHAGAAPDAAGHIHAATDAGVAILHDHQSADAAGAGTRSTAHEHPVAAAPSPTAPHDHAGHDSTASDGECHPTQAQQDAAAKLVADTKAAVVQRFANVQTAVAAGYRPNQSSTGDLGHYINDVYRNNDDILDPNQPEALVYARTDHHGIKLIGVMYMMPKPGMEGPQIGGCLTVWHHHYGDDPGPTGDPEMLHVWTVDMPGGPFTNSPDENYIRNL